MPARIPVVSGVFPRRSEHSSFRAQPPAAGHRLRLYSGPTTASLPVVFRATLDHRPNPASFPAAWSFAPALHCRSRPTLSLIYVSLLLFLASLWRAREASLSLLTGQTRFKVLDGYMVNLVVDPNITRRRPAAEPAHAVPCSSPAVPSSRSSRKLLADRVSENSSICLASSLPVRRSI
jgi:hypothetical protein